MAVYRERRANGAAEIEILFKRHGRGTLLADCGPGDRRRWSEPLGAASACPRAALLVAGGTGIASVAEARRAAARACARIARVLLGARSAVGPDEARPTSPRSGVPLDVATEDGSAGRRGLVTEILERSLRAEAVVYACGPTPLLRRIAALAHAARARAFVSLENTMACGFGVCLGCAVPLREEGYALVCRDGPVFDAAALRIEGLP
jgi:dihydroorotate dehydrogenase electron transfer subunit